MAVIELRNVSKRFPGTTAVRAASFTVEDGEFFILVGPSGCGKSTLLNMIVGLEEVSEGEIRVDGERVDDLDPKDRNMAMVFQSYAIYPHMTVRENIAFPLRLARLPQTLIDARIARAAEILELTECLDRKPRALSGGQRQRVAMGRAIVREPKLFLLDEPLSNLDAKLRVQMRTEIARLQRRLGTTTLYVTHDQTEAMTLGDRIAVLRSGEVQQIGSPRELYERPGNLFVAGFIGSPAMNFLPARYVQGRVELPLGVLSPDDSLRERLERVRGPLVAGFRPEHLRPCGEDMPERALDCAIRADVIEWLGADLFVHFETPLGDFQAIELPEDLAIGGGGSPRARLVARIDPMQDVREGDSIRLCLDPGRIQVFDAGTGANLGTGDDRAGDDRTGDARTS